MLVSTTFYHGSHPDAAQEDTVLVSSDAVHFNVHAVRLLAASANGFNHMLPCVPLATLAVSEPSAVLNLILHSVYNIPCTHLFPAYPETASAVEALSKYGLSDQCALASHSPLSQVLFSYAPICPLDVYTLAASHNAMNLATAASSHLVSFPLSSLTDETAERIGSTYLKKLFFLHLGRIEALKRLLVSPPATHAPTKTCSYTDQQAVARAWALAAAYLSWEARADTSMSTISSTFTSIGGKLSCDGCQTALDIRVRSLLRDWTMVKVRCLCIHRGCI